MAMAEIEVSESKIKAYINGSSSKILQQCQQSYLIKQIERHVCVDEEENLSALFEIDGKHVLEYLSLLRLGKKPVQFNVQKNGTRYESEKQRFAGHTAKNESTNVKILNGLQTHQAKHSNHQRYNSHSIK